MKIPSEIRNKRKGEKRREKRRNDVIQKRKEREENRRGDKIGRAHV